jgi:hypothetical protein
MTLLHAESASKVLRKVGKLNYAPEKTTLITRIAMFQLSLLILSSNLLQSTAFKKAL